MHEQPLDAAVKERCELVVLVWVGAVEAMEGDVKLVCLVMRGGVVSN
jgi:hypothetical protein